MYRSLLIFSIILIISAEKKCPNEQPISRSGVYESDINKIMYYHMKYRYYALVGRIPNQPAASEMELLNWDPDLATKAQSTTDKCVSEITPVEDDRWSAVGQNIFIMTADTSSPSKWEETMESWYDEHEKYTFAKGANSTYNYEQIVWANTTNVGCGFVEFQTTDATLAYHSIYICNYGPAGNVLGEEPYYIKE